MSFSLPTLGVRLPKGFHRMNTTVFMLSILLLCVALPPGSANTARPPVRLAAVQMKADLTVYRDLQTFQNAMDRLVTDAVKDRPKDTPMLVALPEDIGLGLVFLGHWDTVKDANTIREAGGLLGARLGPAVMANVLKHKVSPVRALLITANDGWLRDAYYKTFTDLAKKHKVYLSAGSAPISKPGSADVRNVAVFFAPDGKVLNETAKVHLIDLEIGPDNLDLVPGRIEDLKIAQTPFGKVGTAVCWDAFHDDVIDRLANQGADFVLQPSFNPGPWTKEQEVDWKTGLWARLGRKPAVRAGVNPMMVGGLFEITCEGQSSIVAASAKPDGYLARAASPVKETILVVDVP